MRDAEGRGIARALDRLVVGRRDRHDRRQRDAGVPGRHVARVAREAAARPIAGGRAICGHGARGARVTAALHGVVRDAGVAAAVEAGFAFEVALSVGAGRVGVVGRGTPGVACTAMLDARQDVDARVAAQVGGGRHALARAGPASFFVHRARGRRVRARRLARAAGLGLRQIRFAAALDVSVAVGAIGSAGAVDDAGALHARNFLGEHAFERGAVAIARAAVAYVGVRIHAARTAHDAARVVTAVRIDAPILPASGEQEKRPIHRGHLSHRRLITSHVRRGPLDRPTDAQKSQRPPRSGARDGGQNVRAPSVGLGALSVARAASRHRRRRRPRRSR